MDIKKLIDSYFEREDIKACFVRGLADLIAIPSVAGKAEGEFVFGKETARALEYLLEAGKRFGFETENHDWYCGSIVMAGKSGEEIGIIGHLDVVPAFGEWEFPKYALTVKDGLLIGRGVRDDKGPVAAAMAAMCFFLDSGIKLPFSVRLLLGCCEECGMDDLPHYLSLGKPVPGFSFTPDSSFPVCRAEKGIASFDVVFDSFGKDILSFKGGNVSNAVADSAEMVLSAGADAAPDLTEPGISLSSEGGKLCVKAAGLSSHAATPEGSVNAIVKLAEYVLKTGLVSDSASRNVLEYILASNQDTAGTGLGIACSDELTGALTCICGMGRTDGNRFILNHNVRYPVEKDFETELLPEIKKVCAGFGAEAVLGENSKGYAFPPDAPEIAALSSAFSEITGIAAEPYTMGGGTYARAFPNTVAFGAALSEDVSPLGALRGGAHQNDECIPLDELLTAAKVFALALAHLAGM